MFSAASGPSVPGLAQHWGVLWALSDPRSPRSPTGPCICALGTSAAVPTMEGPLRRKTLLKEGRKPAVSADTLVQGARASAGTWAPETSQPGSQPRLCRCVGEELASHVCKLG